MRFPRVAIVKNNEIIERGWLYKEIPQDDTTYLYEIHGDSAKVYLVKENEFLYIGEFDE